MATDAAETRIRVTGMTCAGCAANVRGALERVPGVATAAVSLGEGLATVTGPGLDDDRLVAAIEARGFGAERLAPEVDPAALRSEAEATQAAAETAWRRRAIVGFAVWIPLETMHWLLPHAPWKPWLMAAGATLVLATCGAGFYRSAWRAARRRTTNMDTLIAIGATTAFLASLVVLLSTLTDRPIAQPTWFTEAAALLAIISLGHWLEARSTAAAGSAVRDLLDLQPETALRIEPGGRERAIPAAGIAAGDRLRVRPFERIPVDGAVVEGESDVDESVVTGEPLPVRRAIGDLVVAGSQNADGTLVLRATTDGRHTTLARIAELVQRAQTSRAPIQRVADRVCAVFVPAVLAIALATAIGWWIAGDPGRGVAATTSVLIISCPCALGLATPMAIMVGTGSASRRGILFKSAAAIERAARARRVVFDKTGTLTTGRPTIVGVEPRPGSGLDADALLVLAASVEAASEHPIARAILREADDRGLDLRPATGFRAIPGAGVEGVVAGRHVAVGRHETASCSVRVDGEDAGTLQVADVPRPDAAEAIRRLRRMGLGIAMLSGDRRASAEAMGERLGIGANEIVAEATPESKRDAIGAAGTGTVMVGDGVNDAAALAGADLGVAMGSGTNVAIESADVVIQGGGAIGVPETLEIARRTLACVRQNLFFAFLYNAAAIPAAAFGLLGPHGPLVAAIAMACSDLTVIGNALRLRAALARRSPAATAPADDR